jgi:hypothetical protein
MAGAIRKWLVISMVITILFVSAFIVMVGQPFNYDSPLSFPRQPIIRYSNASPPASMLRCDSQGPRSLGGRQKKGTEAAPPTLDFVLAELRRCQQGCEGEVHDEQHFSYDSFYEPPLRVSGVETWENGCLERKSERLEVSTSKDASGSNTLPGHTFIATDLCAMGHTTKDPVLLLAYVVDLVDHFRNNQIASVDSTRKVQHRNTSEPLIMRIVYGNSCMSKDKQNVVNKRTPVFHSVLRYWFNAVIDFLKEDLSKDFECDPNQDCKSCNVLKAFRQELRAALPSGLRIEEEFYESHPNTRCYERLVKRKERWRWVRTRRQGDLYRALLQHHLKVGWKKPENPNAVHPLTITVLRRDEDRHFEEAIVAKRLTEQFKPQIQLGLVNVELVAFDKFKSKGGPPPPTYPQQLQILFETDVLIAAHGAGLASIIAMRPHSTVIELFPNNFRYPMYEELAETIGVHYIGIESDIVWPNRCCRYKGGTLTNDSLPPPLQHPSFVHGVGARGCKGCDVHIPGWYWDVAIRRHLNSYLMSNWIEACGKPTRSLVLFD